MRKHLLLIILAVSSFAVHFIYFGSPNEIVFDEVHFGKFISGYFTHEYFFDIHPPLGKLLISGMGYFGGFKPGFSFAEIGQTFSDNSYLWLRFLPTLAGALLPIVIFFLARRIGISKFSSFVAGLFVVLENALLVQSRFILLDSFLLLFGFSALLAYFKYKQEGKLTFLAVAGILGALSVSVKWTGAAFLALIFLFEITNIFRTFSDGSPVKRIFKSSALLILVPVAIYALTFAVHLGLLYRSGPGDAFMSKGFRATLEGGASIPNDTKPLGLAGKIIELNLQMYKSNATLTASHPYSSKWITWPFLIRPIYYWYESGSENTASRIYLMGNPIVWWASTVAILYGLILFLMKIAIRFKGVILDAPIPLFILGAYFLNLLPFIGITRAMFLYHYFSALIFAILALAILLDHMRLKKMVVGTFILVVAAAFIYFAPLSYGLPMTGKSYNNRVWFSSWQ